MGSYILRRAADTAVLLLLSSIVVFGVIRILPGDPVRAYLSPEAPPEAIEAMRERYGFDEALPIQYLVWMRSIVFQLDFGQSFNSRLPVSDLIARGVLPTAQLASTALLFAVFTGLILGVVGALRRGSWLDSTINVYTATALSLPNFWVGMLLLIVAAVGLGWFPAGGYVNLLDDPIDSIRSLILPAIALGWRLAAVITRFIRSGIEQELASGYVRTALSKGLSERKTILGHVLKNASIPLLPVLGVEVGRIFAGAVVIETVFSIPGLGRLVVDATGRRDYALIQALLLLFVLIFSVASLLMDVTHAMIDPRARLEKQRSVE